jgi:phosphoglycolate phosphatase
VFEDLYIVEIIEASHHWLRQRDLHQATLYKNRANQRIVDIELNAAAETRLFAGVEDMLVGLRKNNIKLGIVTRNCRAAIDQVFPDHPQYVDALHARDDVNYLKPNPQHLQDNLTALGAQARAQRHGGRWRVRHAGRTRTEYALYWCSYRQQ